MGKCKCPPPGAPEWIVTYGDMMSLLLTFFILLAALSELKKDDAYKAIAEEVQMSFGIAGAGATFHDAPSLVRMLERMAREQRERKEDGHQDDPGTQGKQLRVQRITPGKQFAVGGRIEFDPGSAALSDAARARLSAIAELVRGKNNKIEVRGHTMPGELVLSKDFTDPDALSFARAKAVKDFLVEPAQGIRPERLVLVAVGDNEPMVKRKYAEEDVRVNRRVEVVVDEKTVADWTHAGKSLTEGE